MFVYSWPGARKGSNVWNGLHYTVREYPFRKCALKDIDYEVDFAEVTSPDDRVAVIATKPLTVDEEWVEMEPGELILFDEGIPLRQPHDCFKAELQGHGLESRVLRPPKLEEDMRRFDYQKSVFAGGGI
jgi:glutamine amidotransferase